MGLFYDKSNQSIEKRNYFLKNNAKNSKFILILKALLTFIS